MKANPLTRAVTLLGLLAALFALLVALANLDALEDWVRWIHAGGGL